MIPSKNENNYTFLNGIIAAALFVGVSGPCWAQIDEGATSGNSTNYIHIETQRVIKLQEENRFLLKKVNDMKEKMEAMQAELLSVRNAFMEREDAIPRTQKEVSSRYEKMIKDLQEEIRALNKELETQRQAFEALDQENLNMREDLSNASRSKSDLLAMISSLEAQLSDVQERLAHERKQAGEMAENLARQDKAQQDLRLKIEAIEEERTDERNNFKDQVARLKKENETTVNSHDEISKKQAHDIEALNKNIEALSKDKENLTAQLAKAHQQAKSMESDKLALAGQFNDVKAQLNEWQTKADALTQQLKAKDVEIASLQESNKLTAQSVSDASARLAEKDQEFQMKLTAQQEAQKAAVQQQAQALEALKSELAAKDAHMASLQSKEQSLNQELQAKLNESQAKLAFAQQQVKESQERADMLVQQNNSLEGQFKDVSAKVEALQQEIVALARVKDEQGASAEKIVLLEKKADEWRGKVQEGQVELQTAKKENELLLSELISVKDERVKLNEEIGALNRAIVDLTESQLSTHTASPQESLEAQETMARLTRELLETENKVYEKELIIEGLREDQERMEKALALAQENYTLLKAELENLKVSEVSYNGRDSVLDLELNKLEERVERQFMER